MDQVHATRLELYNDFSLDEKEIISHVLSSETGILVSRLLHLVEDDSQLRVLVRWKCLSESGNTKESLPQVLVDVLRLVRKLPDRKNTPSELRQKARVQLALWRRGVYRWPDLAIGEISRR